MAYQKETCPAEVWFHRFSQADLGGLIDCIEDFYGKGYPYRQYLDGAFLEAEMGKGNLIVVCGKVGRKVISISAIDFHTMFENSGLLLLRVVKKAYRGRGIGDRQQEVLLGMLEGERQLDSLYADVMTHDCISQKSLIKEGFCICGVRLLLYENRIMVHDLGLSSGSKMSQAVMCRKEHKQQAGQLFCPLEHQDMVASLYEALGAEAWFAAMEQGTAGQAGNRIEKTRYSIETQAQHASTTILVTKAGLDLEAVLTKMMAGKDVKHTYLCYLNLLDAGAPDAYRVLRKQRFFFTGIKPLNTNGEFMILCNVGKNHINTGEIKLHEAGRRLWEYIQTQALLIPASYEE